MRHGDKENTSANAKNRQNADRPWISVTKDKKKKSNTRNNNTNKAENTSAKAKNSQNAKPRVLAKLDESVDITEVRKALDSKSNPRLPEKVNAVLRENSLELNEKREFLISGKYVQLRVKQIFQRSNIRGWLQWMQGTQGWTIEEDLDKNRFVGYFRKLHEVYSHKVLALLKEVKDKTKSVLRLLYYHDPLIVKEDHIRRVESQQTLWKKANKTESLGAAVAKIRPFLDVTKYFCSNPRNKSMILPWLGLNEGQCQTRIADVTQLVKTLMRTSDWGPDAPVHWAAHANNNEYPLALITPDLMTELVVTLANILCLLFFKEENLKMRDLNDVDKLHDKVTETQPDVRVTVPAAGTATDNDNSCLL